MNNENIVKLYNYTETPNEHVMFMEYCDKSSALTEKIFEVSYTFWDNLC